MASRRIIQFPADDARAESLQFTRRALRLFIINSGWGAGLLACTVPKRSTEGFGPGSESGKNWGRQATSAVDGTVKLTLIMIYFAKATKK
jgi:hypothetical protein